MKKWEDTCYRPLEFRVGDLTMVNLLPEHIRSPCTRDIRLIRRYKGLIPIVAKIRRASYKVVTPNWIKVHHVFHVSNLKPYHLELKDEDCNQPFRARADTKLQTTKKLEDILAKWIIKVGHEYWVKWRNLRVEETNGNMQSTWSNFRRWLKSSNKPSQWWHRQLK